MSATCTVCEQSSMGITCPRCGRPLCPAHACTSPPWCEACEEEYLARRGRLGLRWWFLVPFAAVWTFFLLNLGPLWRGEILNWGGKEFTGHPFSDVAALSLVAGILFGGFVAGLRTMIFRAWFSR